jgi:diadenosine tetraphosphate (Ap4A) HIT family hydrolase
MKGKMCPFCLPAGEKTVVAELGAVQALRDRYPVTRLHTLVVPRRHVPDFFSMTGDEVRDAFELVRRLRREIMAADPSVTGFNVGFNCGESAGQTIMHAHIHLIPRREGDTPSPRGGVRGVIPGRMSY